MQRRRQVEKLKQRIQEQIDLLKKFKERLPFTDGMTGEQLREQNAICYWQISTYKGVLQIIEEEINE